MKTVFHRLVAGLNALTPVQPLILRITAAVVMFPHGAQLLLGWFGGPGLGNSLQLLTTSYHLPWLIALVVILLQFFSSVFLLAGFYTRFWAFSMFFVVVGMIFNGHAEHGFFMNWFGQQKGEGFEFHLLLLGIYTALFFSGGGRYAADAFRIGAKKQTR